MEPVTIQALTESDADRYRELRLRSLRDYPLAFGMAYEEEAREPIERVRERLRALSAENFILGALAGEAIVGMVGMNRFSRVRSQHLGQIWGMAVRPDYAGRGVGRALLEEVIRRARAIPGLEELTLAVTVGNDRARRLYAAAGFVTTCVDPRAFKDADGYHDLERMRLVL